MVEDLVFSGVTYFQYKAGVAYEVTFPKKLWDDAKTMSWEYFFDTIDFESRDERRYCILLRRPLHAVKDPYERAIIVMRALYSLLGASTSEVVIEDAEHPINLLPQMDSNRQDCRRQLLKYITERHDVVFDEPYRVMELVGAIRCNVASLLRQVEWLDHEKVLMFDHSTLQRPHLGTPESIIHCQMALDTGNLPGVIKQVSEAPLVSTDGPLRAFISYSTKDKHLAGQIHKVLEGTGIKPFLAHENIDGSEEWMAKILGELEQCHIFVALLTENYRNSKWADHEAGYADARGKRLFPLTVDGDPHGFLGRIQGIQLDPDNVEPACEKIIAVLRSDEKLGPLLSKSQPKQVT